MKRAKLKYSIAQNKKGLHNMLYSVMNSSCNWWCRKYFKYEKYEETFKEIKQRSSNDV
jgi:hypothetical protein